MTAKEWLDLMKQAADYNPAMTKLIEKYGEMLLEEQNVANKNFIKPDVSGQVCEHDYMQRGGAVKYYRCVKCGNEKI